jgi:hypothetical protein
MKFKTHYELTDRHAFLSPSNYHWIRYSDEKLDEAYTRKQATERGTRLHELAKNMILESVKPQNTRATFNLYVNDAIGFHMTPEVALKYSENCFGHVDAISFNKNKLRIHDLKTGVTPAKFDQLLIYAALFCLEYNMSPNDIDVELRIYQFDDKEILVPEPTEILHIMEKIRVSDERIEMLKGD